MERIMHARLTGCGDIGDIFLYISANFGPLFGQTHLLSLDLCSQSLLLNSMN